MTELPQPGALFESHLLVSNLERSISFYRDLLGLHLAGLFDERRAAFFWIGGPGQSMLGLWESRLRLDSKLMFKPETHIAFRVSLDELLNAPTALRSAGVEPLDFDHHPTNEPVVLAWMPAASLYFDDPDGNLLEYITMLDEPARPELGVVSWDEWTTW